MKYSKGKFTMNREGMQLETALSPWLRFCVGAAILLLAATPVVWAVRWW